MPGRADAGLELEILRLDAEVVELCIRAGNARFAGSTDLYVAHGALARLAAGVRGFPSSPADLRQFTLGSFDAQLAGGGCKLALRCASGPAHALLTVQLRTEPGARAAIEETATFVLSVEPAAIERWADALQGLERAPARSRARLDMA